MPQYHPFIRQLHHALRHRCRVNEDQLLLVATSGGADSIALLRGLHLLASRRTWRLRLAVGHVQHHVRDDAEDDARFVRELAERLELPFLRHDLHGYTHVPGNLEGNLRKARYAALIAMADEAAATGIVTGHHADDQLETLLMRMIRGASARGMGGMRWRRRCGGKGGSVVGGSPGEDETSTNALLLRPLLATDRATIIDFLRSIDQPWREDHTNADVSRWRARLRRDVLPVLRDLRPAAPRKVQQFAEQMQMLARWLQEETDAARLDLVRGTDEDENGFLIPRGDARDLPQPMLDLMLRQLMVDFGGRSDRLSATTVRRLSAAIRDQEGGARRFDFSNAVRVIVRRDSILFSRGKS